MNTLNTQLHNFIRDVAQSNLETFHSKAICHVLNLLNTEDLITVLTNCKFHTLDNQSTFKEWLNKGKIQEHFSVSEVSDHDIITCIRRNDNEYIFLIWENKIKASFNLYDPNTLLTEDIEYFNGSGSAEGLIGGKGISKLTQPTYYILRWIIELRKLKSISKSKFIRGVIEEIHNRQLNTVSKRDEIDKKKSIFKLNDTNKINIENLDIKTECIVLSPYTIELFKTAYKPYWKTNIKKISEINNNLHFVEYNSLVAHLKNYLQHNPIALSYLNYCIKPESDISHVPSIYNDPLVKKRQKQFKQLHDIQSKIENQLRKLNFEWNLGGSANSGDILLNIIFPTPKLDFNGKNNHYENTSELNKFFNNQNLKIRWALQLQGNSCKLQFAISDYENANLNKGKTGEDPPSLKYTEYVMAPLIEKSDKEHSKKIREECIYKIFKDIVKKDQIKENKPKTKSGLSYTLWKEDELDYENYGNKLTPEIVLTLAQKLNNFISELESKEVQFR